MKTFATLLLLGAAVAIFAGPAVAAPTIALSLKSGHPKISTAVTGTGFTPNEAVDVYFDTTDEFLAVTDNAGAFGGHGITIPKDALPGTHWITAVGRKAGDAAQQPFTVRTDWVKHGFDAQHRGRNPYENVIDPSNVGTLDLAWSYSTGGPIFGSPMVYGGRIYVGSDDHKLYALTTKGTVLWSATTGGAVESTPAYAGGKVYVGSNDGKIYAYDWNTGALKWSKATAGPVLSSPAVVGNTLYVGSEDSSLYALNATTGATIWSTPTTNQITWSSPAIAYGMVFIGSTDDRLWALDANTGAVRWWYTTSDAILGSPAIANGAVYFTSHDSSIIGLKARNANYLWDILAGGSVNSSPTIFNDKVFVGGVDTYVRAIDASDGPEGSGWATALHNSVDLSPVAIANGVGYVGTLDRIYGLDLKTGAKLWSAQAQGVVEGAAIADGVVYFTSADGNVYAYALDGGSNVVYRRDRRPPSYASLHPDRRLKPLK